MDTCLHEIERSRNGLRRGMCFCFDADGMIGYNEERRNGAQPIQNIRSRAAGPDGGAFTVEFAAGTVTGYSPCPI